MSVSVVRAVFRAKLGDPRLKLVALKLADDANEHGAGILPPYTTLTKQVGYPVTRKTIRALIAKGILHVDDSAHYLLTPEKMTQVAS